jgi:hypothetical protein
VDFDRRDIHVCFIGAAVGLEDVGCTKALIAFGASAWFAKSLSPAFGVVPNFAGRRFVVFPKS